MSMETMEAEKPEAVIYVRVASVELHNRDGNVTTQEQRCRKYAIAQGYAVTRVFTDAGVSGSTAERPGLNAMLTYLETMPDRDIVVVTEDSARLEFCDENVVANIDVASRIQFTGARRVQP